eukprot:1627677-Amphidinium_carterae.2
MHVCNSHKRCVRTAAPQLSGMISHAITHLSHVVAAAVVFVVVGAQAFQPLGLQLARRPREGLQVTGIGVCQHQSHPSS